MENIDYNYELNKYHNENTTYQLNVVELATIEDHTRHF